MKEKVRGCKISGSELIAHYYTKKRSMPEEGETSASAIQEFVDPRAKDFMVDIISLLGLST